MYGWVWHSRMEFKRVMQIMAHICMTMQTGGQVPCMTSYTCISTSDVNCCHSRMFSIQLQLRWSLVVCQRLQCAFSSLVPHCACATLGLWEEGLGYHIPNHGHTHLMPFLLRMPRLSDWHCFKSSRMLACLLNAGVSSQSLLALTSSVCGEL